jgi:osmotically-inducible protein OsmY
MQIADTKLTIGGCKVFIGHSNRNQAVKVAKSFSKVMNQMADKANEMSMRDLIVKSQNFAEMLN